ncbi:cobalt-precorrin-6A reductase [Thalassospiraceae bacterium LMO-JJ14]|nr:cobalt-precorrin-6A reductase [Thalassospiraceae bacterium LMO-JJ14]
MSVKTLVILGGTAEARKLADALVDKHGDALRVITSLAGRTKNPKHPKGEVRNGGFGGARGLADYLRDVGATLLIDATHPYAQQITRHAAEASDIAGVARLVLDRPAWTEQPGDRWIHVPSLDAAVREISRKSDACLITTGVNDLAAFAPIRTSKLFVRLIEKPQTPLPLGDAEIVIGTPPYIKDDETALMRLLGIDLMVTKNAGGAATYAKIEAARALGIEVIMIDRPPLPGGDTVADVEAALARAEALLG